MFIDLPQIKNRLLKGKICNNTISALDILPTICDVAGVSIPHNIDGKSINKLLTGENLNIQNDTLIWDKKKETAVRIGNWKLKTAIDNKHVIGQNSKIELGEFLYNLKNDPGEKIDLADKYPEKMQELKAAYSSWRFSINN